MLDAVQVELQGLGDAPMTADVGRVEARLYRLMPVDEGQFLAACDELMASRQWPAFWLVTRWVKRRGDLYQRRHFDRYERWLHEFAGSWGRCDVLCYRVLNPMVERFPQLFSRLLEWARSPRTYVRRAAAVALIECSQRSFVVNAGFERVAAICNLLKRDEEIHVQKGIGWLLKYAYLAHPGETVNYLTHHVGELSRTTFRYGLEKMPPGLRAELMAVNR